MYSIGVDIGGSHIAFCIYEQNRVDQKKDTGTQKKRVPESWARVISKSIKQSEKEVEEIGIAMQGSFNYYQVISRISGVNKRKVLYGLYMPKMDNINVSEDPNE